MKQVIGTAYHNTAAEVYAACTGNGIYLKLTISDENATDWYIHISNL